MPHRVLNEDWTDYDNRKIRGSKDRAFFSCEEEWEVDYLVKKILKYHPNSEVRIRSAIMTCCREIPGNKPRKRFVECVMGKL